MSRLSALILIAGLLHFAILSASALVPIVLDWRRSLAALQPFLRTLIWVYGAFIVLVIIGFGALSVLHANLLAAGTPLARSLCGFIAVFWGARLFVQLFIFDIRDVVKSRLLLMADHLLTLVFIYFTAVYAIAAIAPKWI